MAELVADDVTDLKDTQNDGLDTFIETPSLSARRQHRFQRFIGVEHRVCRSSLSIKRAYSRTTNIEAHIVAGRAHTHYIELLWGEYIQDPSDRGKGFSLDLQGPMDISALRNPEIEADFMYQLTDRSRKPRSVQWSESHRDRFSEAEPVSRRYVASEMLRGAKRASSFVLPAREEGYDDGDDLAFKKFLANIPGDDD